MRIVSIAPAIVIGLILALIVPVAYTRDDVKTVSESRYVSVRVGAMPDQQDLLESIVDIQVPEYAHNIGQALEYLLAPFGFRLDDMPEEGEQFLLFVLPLPEPHRQLGPLTLMDAVTTLGAPGFQPLINPVKRTIGYQLRDGFGQFVTDEDLDQGRTQWLEGKERISLSPNAEIFTVLVQQGDSLSHIVNVLDLGGITTDQALALLFQANPHAFVNNNMNHLLAGTTLTIPPVQSDAFLSVIEARELVDRHYRLWDRREVKL
jgi:type IV pili sensor histidine kinase/response regulator